MRNHSLARLGLAALAAAALAAAPLQGQTMGFGTYLDSYLAASASIAQAEKAKADADLAYEGGVARKASSAELESLLATKERKALDLRDARNQAAIDAFSLLVQRETALASLAIAQGRHDIAVETAKGDAEQYSLGLISETDHLNKRSSLLAAKDSLESAKRSLEDVETKIRRALGISSLPSLAPLKKLDAKAMRDSLAAPGLEAALAASAERYSAKATLDAKEKAWKVISASLYAKDSEKKDAQDALDSAKQAYDKAVQAVEDSSVSLARGITDLKSSYEKLLISLRVSEISLEAAALRRSYGDKTELEYKSATLDRAAKLDEEAQFAFRVVQKVLEALKLSGGDCAAYLKARM